jgi:hypothetical protein
VLLSSWQARAQTSSEDQPISALNIAFYGVYDTEADSVDSDLALDVEGRIRQAMAGWRGFNVVPESQLARALPRVDRAFIAQSDRPAERLSSMETLRATGSGDIGVVAKVRLAEGKRFVRMRLISLPDRVGRSTRRFADVWTDEQELENLQVLVDSARPEAYTVGNERVQARPWGNAILAHVAPAAGFVGHRVRLLAGLLCRGTCNVELHYQFTTRAGQAQEQQSRPMELDHRLHAWRADLTGLPTGTLHYWFGIVGPEQKNIDAEGGSAGSKEDPFEVRIVQPAPHMPPDAPDPGLELEIPPLLPGSAALGLAGAMLITSISLAAANHVWYAGHITEVQAAQARRNVPAVYATLSISGALAITGGTLLGLQLWPQTPGR